MLDDPAVSRLHFEVRVEDDGVTIVDQSTNGTRVNGIKLERDEPVALNDSDFIEIGTLRMSFRSLAAGDRISDAVRTAVREIERAHVASVVGDIVGYTALAERDGEEATAAAADELFASLDELLAAHGATTSHRDGDSLFAAWGVAADPQAADKAVRFALAAAELVDDTALEMGWGVTLGDPAPAHPTRRVTRSTPTRSTSPSVSPASPRATASRSCWSAPTRRRPRPTPRTTATCARSRSAAAPRRSRSRRPAARWPARHRKPRAAARRVLADDGDDRCRQGRGAARSRGTLIGVALRRARSAGRRGPSPTSMVK